MTQWEGEDNPVFSIRRGNRTERLNKVFVTRNTYKILVDMDRNSNTVSPAYTASIALEELRERGQLEEYITSYRKRKGHRHER